ncbi:hypothetical protein BSLA_01r2364, partial [Burkholderia stabilis]
MRPKPPITSS